MRKKTIAKYKAREDYKKSLPPYAIPPESKVFLNINAVINAMSAAGMSTLNRVEYVASNILDRFKSGTPEPTDVLHLFIGGESRSESVVSGRVVYLPVTQDTFEVIEGKEFV